ncbi:MAG: hypothetical protein COV72_05075 [Candidatus Omnitrophica bacterium CG11_big_fil_rev_8_21_14_0_20_42_13]|uniref:Type 4 fimbrial biogenesis protein PilX N-terminal domain-containing protein n=1 Tax=Candidatus Ghiorseimicrobium undicola TaxID=1974746 RepID=A0A2H0LXA5_9BACT|nr:MAG: hypothetical protein COV72_05075 [Candidatus Omnitrophica bacterium CG11_big_fil_rev_8_21_14_0_20_42_13]
MKIRKDAAFIIIATYLIISVLLILIISFAARSVSEMGSASRRNNAMQAFYLAESGIDSALVWLRTSYPAALPYNSGTVNLGNGSFSFTVSSPVSLVYNVESTAVVGNENKTIKATFSDDHYARYAYFTDQERFMGINVWFVDGDLLKGPVQTNGRFKIKGGPVFEGEVKSGDNYIRYYNNGNPKNLSSSSNPPYDMPDFQQGIDLGADPVAMPASALNLRTAASGGGIFLTGNSAIAFNADGTMNVTNANKGWNNFNTSIPANGAIFVDNGDLDISGTVKGSVSVGSERDIIVSDNVVYSDDPRVNPDSADKLGIVAEKNVIIPQSAPYDLEIDASIMALGSSFTVFKYWQGPPKGTLTVYGGIIQNQRGPVGTFDGSTGEKLSGYNKDYSYDSRFTSNPPPYNPTTGDYIITSWREE